MGVWQLVGCAALTTLTVVRIALVVAAIVAVVGMVSAVLRADPTAAHTPS